MPITPGYTLASTIVPPLAVASSTLIVPGTTTPPITPILASGDTTAVVTKSKTQAGNLDVLARYGGGAYAIATGLALSDGGGLVCNVSAGQAFLDGPATLASAGAVALADNAYNWLYILPSGALTKTSDTVTTPPAAPNSGLCVFLGRVTTLSAAITAISYDGRPDLGQGNLVYVRTADAGVPAWTPTPGIRFLHQTAGGMYLWDGAAYRKFVNAAGVADSDLATSYIKADGTRAFTGDQSMGSHKLTNVTNGSSAQDAAAFGQIPLSGSPVATGNANAAGSASTYAKSDHVHAIGSSSADGSTLEVSGGALRMKDAGTTAAKLTAALSALVGEAPSLSAGAEVADAITVTIQARDASAASLSAVRLSRVWISDTQYGAECASAPNGGVTVGTGTTLQTVTANKHYVLVTNASGVAALTLTETTAKSFWVMADVGGRIGSVQVTFV